MQLNDYELVKEIYANLNSDLFLIAQSYNRCLILYLDIDMSKNINWFYLVYRDLSTYYKNICDNRYYMNMYLSSLVEEEKNISIIHDTIYYNTRDGNKIIKFNNNIYTDMIFEKNVCIDDIQWLKSTSDLAVYKGSKNIMKMFIGVNYGCIGEPFLCTIDETYVDAFVSDEFCCMLTKNNDINFCSYKNKELIYDKNLIVEKNSKKIFLTYNNIILWLTTGEIVVYDVFGRYNHTAYKKSTYNPPFNDIINCFQSGNILCFQLLDGMLKFISFSGEEINFTELKLECLDKPFSLVKDIVEFEGWMIVLGIDGKYQIIVYNVNHTYSCDRIYGDINKVIDIKENIAEIFSDKGGGYIVFRSVDNNFYKFEPITKWDEYMYNIGDDMYAKKIILS